MQNYLILLFVVLWLYAAVVKGIDLKEFRFQMQESPILPKKLIPFLLYFIPISEIVLAFCLVYNLYSGNHFILWTNFIYIFSFTIYLIILKIFFSKNLPCACGGIFGMLPYFWHILLNIIFCMMALYLIF